MSGPLDGKQAMIGEEAMTLWGLALGTLLLVTLVVAGLLYWLQNRAREIDQLVGAIWQAGQRVAANTVHIPKLYGVADGVEAILGSARRTLGHADAIAHHAAHCTGCPQCIWRG
jgi:hypothetical protein